jgi:hypothetical protein
LINLYRYDVGAFIPGLDIVIPPVQPFRQIEGFLEESPLVRGSRRWDGGGGVEVGVHALPGVRLVTLGVRLATHSRLSSTEPCFDCKITW